MMYTLIASDSPALQSAVEILLKGVDPDAELLFASNIMEIKAYLNLGCVRAAVIDPATPGYGAEFDLARLAREYPQVRFAALSPGLQRTTMFDSIEGGMAQAPVAVFFPPGNPILPKRMSPSCLGEPRLKLSPASS